MGLSSCPKLQELKIHSRSNTFPTDEALFRFISARMEAESPDNRSLTRVELQVHRLMVLDIRPRIQPFLDTGFHLDATYSDPPRKAAPMFSVWQGLPLDSFGAFNE